MKRNRQLFTVDTNTGRISLYANSLQGEGQCACKRCSDEGKGTGAFCWTSMCVEFEDHIYCYPCFEKIVKERYHG